MKLHQYTLLTKSILALAIWLSVVGTLFASTKKPKVTTFSIEKGINISAWLSQSNLQGEAKLKYFTETDLQELARLGFDHIRLPFNENQLYSADGTRNEETFKIIHNVIDWCRKANMRIILDCHQTYDHDFSKFSSITLFKDPAAQDRFEVLWQKLCAEFGKYPNELVAYEILNEPNALESKSWNAVANKIVKVIRKAEPERIIFFGSNKANRVTTFPDLQIPPNDPNIILSFHFYYPYLITHFNSSSYKSLKVIKGPLVYPGQLVPEEVVSNLDDDAKKVLQKHNGVFNKQVLYEMIRPAIEKAKATGLRIHCGEFGCNFQYNDTSLLTRYIKDVVSIFNENNIPYTVWGYRKQFGVFDDSGKIKSQEYLDAIVK